MDAATGSGYECLRFLSQQRLEHTPGNFTLAYHVKTDRRSLTAMAVDAILMEGRTLTQPDADRITAGEARRTAPAQEADDPRHDALRHQTLRLADLAAGAASQSSGFGQDLETGLSGIGGSEEGAGSIREIVEAMVQRTRVIEAQLTAAAKEIETLRQQVEVSRVDAQRDALTGLFNRRGAIELLSTLCRSKTAVVALCDIDHFKRINDRFGHGVGDRVLKAVAGCLVDTIGSDAVCRWGGEEFLIALDAGSLAAAVEMLERARRNLEARSFRNRADAAPLDTITLSIGAAPLAGGDHDRAIETADRMLYAAKRGGRNRVVMASPTDPGGPDDPPAFR